MLGLFNGLRDLTVWSVAMRIIVTFICGLAVGLERSYKNRPAGIRTHIMICLAASIASMTGVYLFLIGGLPTDVSRLGAQVVSGLGFIGGGTIIVTRKNAIKGLATGAGLWATGVAGLAIGAGYYEGGIVVTVLILITETFIARLGLRIRRDEALVVTLRYREKAALEQVLHYCADNKMTVHNLRVVGSLDGESREYTAVITLRGTGTKNTDALERYIQSVVGIQDVQTRLDEEDEKEAIVE